MLNTLVVLILLAVVAWGLWTLWKSGWDVKKAGAALVAAAAAAWLWIHDSLSALISSQ